jgi:hypothetical protein
MVIHSSQFTIVHCPVCGVFIDLKTAEHGLVEHLHLEHAQTELKPVVCLLEDKLGLGHTNNLDSMDVASLRLCVEKLCQQEATSQGNSKLSRNLKKYQKRRLDRKTT